MAVPTYLCQLRPPKPLASASKAIIAPEMRAHEVFPHRTYDIMRPVSRVTETEGIIS